MIEKIYRLSKVIELTGMSRSSIYIGINNPFWYERVWMIVTLVLGVIFVTRGIFIIFFLDKIKQLMSSYMKHYYKFSIPISIAMVVIASMIGVKGLGVPILRAVMNQYLALGLFNGLAIVAIAIIFDRISQEYGRRIQKHRGIKR